jgi:hypothetical protein
MSFSKKNAYLCAKLRPKIVKHFYTILLLSCFSSQVYAQKAYKTHYDLAFSVEFMGISPETSLNLEYVPLQYKRSFLSLRVGAGFMFMKNRGVSFPSSVTYNLLLTRPNSQECNPFPRKTQGEWFLEMGVGQTLASYYDEAITDKKYYISPILGLRKQILRQGFSNIFFYKFQLTPRKIADDWEFYGGISIGSSF